MVQSRPIDGFDVLLFYYLRPVFRRFYRSIPFGTDSVHAVNRWIFRDVFACNVPARFARSGAGTSLQTKGTDDLSRYLRCRLFWFDVHEHSRYVRLVQRRTDNHLPAVDDWKIGGSRE